MNKESQIDFPGSFRVHIGLSVQDVAKSTDYYSKLFGIRPAKVRVGYAKFEPEDPSVNLSLNQVSKVLPHNSESHYGIQVRTAKQLQDMTNRLQSAGLKLKTEEQVTCCYAVQDKIWTVDPDGNAWEVFLVTDANANRKHDVQSSETSECCDPACCTGEEKNHEAKQESVVTISQSSGCCES